jgi:hypothetical protein
MQAKTLSRRQLKDARVRAGGMAVIYIVLMGLSWLSPFAVILVVPLCLCAGLSLLRFLNLSISLYATTKSQKGLKLAAIVLVVASVPAAFYFVEQAALPHQMSIFEFGP